MWDLAEPGTALSIHPAANPTPACALPCLQSTDLLSKQFLLLPLVDAEHASLLIVCQPPAGAGGIVAEQGRCILHLDSGGGPQPAASVGMCLAAGKALNACWWLPDCHQ